MLNSIRIPRLRINRIESNRATVGCIRLQRDVQLDVFEFEFDSKEWPGSETDFKTVHKDSDLKKR